MNVIASSASLATSGRATITSGARLVASFLTAGGNATSNVTLTVDGGHIESPGTISLLRGAMALVFNSGRMEAQDIVLGSPGAPANLTLLGAGLRSTPTERCLPDGREHRRWRS